MLLGQRVALTLLAQGDRSIGKIAEYMTQFISDHIANFIISCGGWVGQYNVVKGDHYYYFKLLRTRFN